MMRISTAKDVIVQLKFFENFFFQIFKKNSSIMDYLKISVQSPDHKKLFELLRTLYKAVELVRDL